MYPVGGSVSGDPFTDFQSARLGGRHDTAFKERLDGAPDEKPKLKNWYQAR